MKPLHNGRKGNRTLTMICTFLILSSIYLISNAFTSLPGTYAWFTAGTSALGTIQNATTEDMLQIRSSEITYGKECSINHSLSIKNISDMSTNVSIFLKTASGEERIISQKLKPGATLETAPDATSDPIGGCEATSLDYHIKAFSNYVDESYNVAVDPVKMNQPTEPEPDEEKVEEKVTEQAEPEKDRAEEAEPVGEETDGKGEDPVRVDEEEVEEPPVVEEQEQEEKIEDGPQEDEDVSNQDDTEESAVEDGAEEKQGVTVTVNESEQNNTIVSK